MRDERMRDLLNVIATTRKELARLQNLSESYSRKTIWCPYKME